MQRKVKHILLTVLATIVALSSTAQNNPYKIDDELYSYYLRIQKVQKEERGIAMCDTMFQMAACKRDVKAQCIALYGKCTSYYYQNDMPSCRKALKNLREFAIKTPYHQYIFGAWTHIVNYYLKNLRYAEAIDEQLLYQQEAIRLNNVFGIYTSYRNMGNMYYIQMEYTRAVEQYDKAIKYVLDNKYNTGELYNLYLGKGKIYCAISEYDSAKVYLQKALEVAPNGQYEIQIYNQMGIMYIGTGELDKVKECIEGIDERKKIFTLNSTSHTNYIMLLIKYYKAINEYDKALALCDSLDSRMEAAEMRSSVYEGMGNCVQAFQWYKEQVRIREENRTEKEERRFAEVTARFNNQQLENEKNRMALQMSQLQMERLNDEKRLMEIQWEKDTLTLHNTKLELCNKELALQKERDAAERERIQNKAIMERAESVEKQSTMKNIIIGIALILLLTILIYVRHRRLAIRRIVREKNNALSAQKEAEQARQEAENANRLKSLFLQNMSHEIRTPLNAIVGFTGVLNSGEDVELSVEERKEMLGLIETNTELLTTLINDILDLSKLESNTYTLNLAPVGIAELCHSIIVSMSHRVPPGVELRLEEPDIACSVTLNTDAARLQQVLNNFLTNACKYTEKGSIILAYRILDNAIEFSVTDTGSGIPADKAETIFERFEKLDSFKQGTGLGLNICRRIADLVGGRVYVDTSYTGGARFVFLHPIKIKD